MNPLTGTEIESTGGWGEIGFKTTNSLSLYVGASIDDPKDEQLPTAAEIEAEFPNLKEKELQKKLQQRTGRTLNQVVYVSSRWKPWKPFLVGVEYYYWMTEYKGLEKGKTNRVTVHTSYVF